MDFNAIVPLVQLVLTAGVLASLVVVVVAVARFRRKVAEVERGFRAFVSSPSANVPSPLAQVIDSTAQIVARACIAQAQTTIMGIRSGASRAEKTAEAAAVMGQYPWLAFLDKLSPGLSKTLVKNPQLLNLGAQLFKGKGQASILPASDNGHTAGNPPSLTLGGD